MPTTTNLGMAVSSDQRDYVLEYWMKMLNEENGNFVLLDNEFGVLASKLAFTIYPASWVAEEHAPFYYKSTVTINAIVQDNSIVEAYFEDILVSTGVILHSVTQNGTQLELVFYADAAKQSAVSGFIKYVYSVPGQDPLPVPEANVEPKTITENGTYDAHDQNKDGFNPVVVNVTPSVSPLSITANGTYSAPAGTDGYNPIDVNVPDTGAGIIEGNVTEIYNSNVKYIRSSAFLGCSTLTKISFPNCITIGQSAFYSCSNIEEINIPKCVTMGGGAFGLVNNFVSRIDMPYLRDAGNSAFYSFSQLKEAFFPRMYGLTPSNAFKGCVLLNNIEIPFTSKIYSSGFAYCRNLTELNLLNCSEVDYYAFQNCSALSKIIFGCHRVAIKEYVFTNLSTSTNNFRYMLGNFNYISNGVFNGLSLFSELYTMGTRNVPTLNNVNAFSNTPMQYSSYLGYFGSIYVHPDMVEAYKSATNWATYSDRIVAAPSEVVNKGVWAYEFYSSTITEIPSEKVNAETIGNYAFYQCQQLSEVNLSKVKIVGEYAFSYCPSLTEINLPNCSFIGTGAFRECNHLLSVNFPKCFGVGTQAFMYCTRLTEANFPECNFIIGDAFNYCSALSSISFPECLEIGYNAFNYCSSLTEAIFPKCLSIGNFAFSGCFALSSISFPKCSYIGQYAFSGCSRLTEAIFPECLSIEYCAFSGCSRLTEANFPECLYIGQSAFVSCYSLTEANFPKCLSVMDSAFYSCSALSSISFPKCHYMGGSNFYLNSKITSVYLPHCLTIGQYAFYSCSALSSLSLPRTTRIDRSAFCYCNSLSYVYLPKCVNFGVEAFGRCSNLKVVSVPAPFQIGATGVFYYCSKLESVYFLGSIVGKTDWDMFADTPLSNSSLLGYYGSIYVRASLLSQWQSGNIFSQYSARFVGLTDEEIAALDNQ